MASGSDRTSDEQRQLANFLSIAAHDIRAPLANVRSYASLLLSAQPALDARQHHKVEVIMRNSDRAILLLEEFIDSWTDRLGGLEVNLTEQRLVPLIQEAVEKQRPITAEKELRLEISLPTSELQGRVDRHRIVHATGAFLEHAVLRAPPQTTVRLNACQANNCLEVEVLDQGPRLSATELEQYFDPDRGVAIEGKLGTRFRLGVAAAEVHAHGGEVGHRTRQPDGGSFFFTLPLC